MRLRVTVLHSTLRPGHETLYERGHARIPTELMALLRAGGVRDWVIWRDGLRLLHLVDVDDFPAFARAVENDAVNVQWQQDMAQHVEGFQHLDAIPALHTPTLVWSMHAQRSAECP